jgi:hypothetical protein
MQRKVDRCRYDYHLPAWSQTDINKILPNTSTRDKLASIELFFIDARDLHVASHITTDWTLRLVNRMSIDFSFLFFFCCSQHFACAVFITREHLFVLIYIYIYISIVKRSAFLVIGWPTMIDENLTNNESMTLDAISPTTFESHHSTLTIPKTCSSTFY